MEFEHESVLAELAAREPIFHRPEFGRTRAEFEAMMDPEFREVGASGREYTRDFVLGVLEERYSASFEDRWETTDFRCQSLAPDLYLLTYKLVQDGTRRSPARHYLEADSGGLEDRVPLGNTDRRRRCLNIAI